MTAEVINIKYDGGSNGNDVIDKAAHGVRTRVGRLRKHSVLKSDWFSVI